MCCARTAALQGGFEKQNVNASGDFLQQSLHLVPESFESYAETCFEVMCGMYLAPTKLPNPPKSTLWTVLGAKMRP